MPSHLRIQSSFEPISANAINQKSPTLPAARKSKMSLAQTYYAASTARSKLSCEASQADHNLRHLVGHANLLDTLIVELVDAKRGQEAWLNQSVKKAAKVEATRHFQGIISISEVEEEESDDESDMESDDGNEIYDEDVFDLPLRKLRSLPVEISSAEVSGDEKFDDDHEEDLALTRTISNKLSLPELIRDSDSESEDDSISPSSENSAFELSEKQRQVNTTTNLRHEGCDNATTAATTHRYL